MLEQPQLKLEPEHAAHGTVDVGLGHQTLLHGLAQLGIAVAAQVHINTGTQGGHRRVERGGCGVQRVVHDVDAE